MTEAMDNQQPDPDETGPVGIFPSWKAVYWSVVIYTTVTILVLYWFTISFDFHVG